MESKSVSAHALSIRSVQISPDRKEPFVACIQVKKEDIRLMLLDPENAQILEFEEIQITRTLGQEERAVELEEIFKNSILGGLHLAQLTWIIETPHFCLLPVSLFDPAHAQMYLEQVAELSHMEQVLAQPAMDEAVLVYSNLIAYSNLSAALFPDTVVEWKSSLSGLIAFGKNVQKDAPFLLLQIENNQLFALGFSEGQLVFINRFEYFTENDLLYFTLLALKEMHLEPDTALVLLSGNLQADSLGYEKLNRYLGRMEFVKPVIPLLQPQLDFLNKPAYFDLISNLKK